MKCDKCKQVIGNYARCPKCGHIIHHYEYIKMVNDFVPSNLAKYYKARFYSVFAFLLYYPLLVIVNIWYAVDTYKANPEVFNLSRVFAPSIYMGAVFGAILIVLLICKFVGDWRCKK